MNAVDHQPNVLNRILATPAHGMLATVVAASQDLAKAIQRTCNTNPNPNPDRRRRTMPVRTTQDAFWNLSAAEMAALTDDEMRGICKLALMEAGVLDPQQPTILPEDAPALETEPVYALAHDGYHDLCIAFRTEEEAAAAAAQHPMRLDKDWQTQVFSAHKLEGLRIERREVPTVSSLARHKEALKVAHQNKTTNEANRVKYNKACEESGKITLKLWEARNEAADRARHLMRIRITFTEYLTMTGGDDAMARSFLAKVKEYDEDDVREAIGEAPKAVLQVLPSEAPPMEALSDADRTQAEDAANRG